MQMHYLANAYARRGHSVTMFCPYAEPAQDALYSCVSVPVGSRMRTFRFAWNLRKQDFAGFDLLHAAMDDYWLLGKSWPFHIRTFHGSCLAEAVHIRGGRDRLKMPGLWAWCVSCANRSDRYCGWGTDRAESSLRATVLQGAGHCRRELQ